MAKTHLSEPFLAVMIIIILPFYYSNLSHCCPLHQKQALLQFKSLFLRNLSSNMDIPQDLQSWNSSSSDCCKWKRVSCESTTQPNHVTHLRLSLLAPSLSQKTLVPSSVLIPLFRLRTLQVLDVSQKAIQGEIPNEISNLSDHLQRLLLRENKFSGAIPVSVLGLRRLEYLDVSKNLLSMEIPAEIGEMLNLSYLNLAYNNFSGTIPPPMQKMERLEYLNLRTNLLHGEIPTWVFNFTRMKGLFLGENQLSLEHVRVAPKSKLWMLSLIACNIQGPIPFWLSNQTDLQLLNLRNNDLNGELPPWLAKMKLKSLILSTNQLSGTIPESILNIPNLRFLKLSHNKFSGIEVPIFNQNSSLVFVDVSKNRLFGEITVPLPPSIKVLILSQNRISNLLVHSDIHHQDYSSRLKYLDLQDNIITGEFPMFVTHMSSLQILSLRNNNIEGLIPSGLSNLKRLQILDLSHNKMIGNIPSTLGNLLGMINNGGDESPTITIDFPMVIYSWYFDLKVFWKYSERGLFSNVVHMYNIIDLSNNQFNGEIPDKLGNLIDLKALNLSNNKFWGSIPESFGNLENLESMDLSHNDLSGKIPSSFSKLFQLNNLDLSNNELEGRIPEGSQMDRLNDPNWYANNSGLCGIQIQIPCKTTSSDEIESADEKSDDDQREIWFSWKMVAIAYPLGFLLTMFVLYGIGFF